MPLLAVVVEAVVVETVAVETVVVLILRISGRNRRKGMP